MGRVTGRSGREKGRGPRVDAEQVSRGLRLGVGTVVAALAVVALLPALVVQEAMRRRRLRSLLLVVALALGAGYLLVGGQDEAARPVAAVATPAAPVVVDGWTVPEVGAVEWVPLEPASTTSFAVYRSGLPAAGFRVSAWRRGLEGGPPLAEAVTDADGLAALPEGDLTYVVDLGGGRIAAPADGMSVDLDAPRLLEGTVVGPTDEGVPAEVTAWLGAMRIASARADLRGAFRLEGAHAPGVVITATAPGFVPARAPLDEAGLLRLRRGQVGALAGRVLDEHGVAVPGAVVRALSGERTALLAATDDLGRFAFPAVEPGAVTLEVHRAGEAVPALRAAARVGADVDLRLQAPAALEVSVRAGERPLAGAAVQLVDPAVTRYGGFSESLAQPRSVTDAAGVARFSGLPAGRYHVRATVDGRPLLGEVELVGGATASVSLDAQATRSLTVRVVDERGDPVAGVFMDVSMPGINWHGMPSSRTDASGVATFHELPPGLAEVHLGKGDLWRMARAAGDEATFVWSEARAFDLQGWLDGFDGEVLIAYVLPDVVHMSRARVTGGLLDTTIRPPSGAGRVFLLAPERTLAPIDLGPVAGDLHGFRAAFAPGVRITGRLVDARTGRGIAGRVRLPGALAGALEAHTQWLGGTDHDEWITVNEWSRATAADGSFDLIVPRDATTLELDALGARTSTASLGERDLGDLPLDPR